MEVPTISLASYFKAGAINTEASKAESDELADLVSSIRAACEDVGFFIVVDHGIDATLLEAQRRECHAFFSRPPQSLIAAMVQGSESRFHWLDYVPSDVGSCTNASEAWSLGPVQGRGSMPWQLDSETMKATWMSYYRAMESLVAVLMRLLALALGMSEDSFEKALVGHRSSLRAILYPTVTETDLKHDGGIVVRSGEHSDWGCITVLLADEKVGGLEVVSKDGVWATVPVVPGGLVVNLGDLLHRWTGGRWLATPHRVVARPDTRHERLSIPYFGLVNRATVIEPLISLVPGSDQSDVAAEFAPITAGEFFDRHEEYVKRKRGELH